MRITGYKLTLYWIPQQCRSGSHPGEGWCEGRGRFALHGLWPDGEGGRWPQYCRSAPLLTAETVRRNYCATPSVQLLQHEWAKHGTCTTRDPDAFFDEARRLYQSLRYPDMVALARQPNINTATIARAFVQANRGLPMDAVQVKADRRGWLEEVWICLDRNRRYVACPGRHMPNRPAKVATALPRR